MKEIQINTLQTYISSLSASDHTIWRATKYFKKPTAHVPSKKLNRFVDKNRKRKDIFTKYIETNSTPQIKNLDVEIKNFLTLPFQMFLLNENFTVNEINSRKNKIDKQQETAEFDLTDVIVLKKIPLKGIQLFQLMCNALYLLA